VRDDIFCGLRGIYDPSHIGESCRTYECYCYKPVISICPGG
jgi:hypothetical protein